MLSSSPPTVSGTDQGGNPPSRALGPEYYIPNKKQVSTPPSEEKNNPEDFKNLIKLNHLSHLGLLFIKLPDTKGFGRASPVLAHFAG